MSVVTRFEDARSHLNLAVTAGEEKNGAVPTPPSSIISQPVTQGPFFVNACGFPLTPNNGRKQSCKRLDQLSPTFRRRSPVGDEGSQLGMLINRKRHQGRADANSDYTRTLPIDQWKRPKRAARIGNQNRGSV